MPRLARATAVGCAHHVTQRGNNRQDVFLADEDRRVYLELLQEQARKWAGPVHVIDAELIRPPVRSMQR